MDCLTVNTAGNPSRILVGRGSLSSMAEIVSGAGLPSPRSVVSNTTVGPLYGGGVATALGDRELIQLPDGERYKRWEEIERLCRSWLEAGLHRRDSVLAIGGGVVTDITGFAASVYLRGISWVAVPTTLLAMVDASVGGKTGINPDRGKNLIGTFWQPELVVVDCDTLATLPDRERRAGAAEVIKSAWIGDHDLLDALEPDAPFTDSRWDQVVLRSISVKAAVVEEDEREAGPRMSLNFGHTLGHALESVTSYRRFLHGEAVAWGLLAAASLGRRHGLLGEDSHSRLTRAVASLGELPPIADLDADRVLEYLNRDKKRDDLGVAWVLPTDDGVVLDQRVALDEIRAVFEELAGS